MTWPRRSRHSRIREGASEGLGGGHLMELAFEEIWGCGGDEVVY